MKLCQSEKVSTPLPSGGTFRLAYTDEAAGPGRPEGGWSRGTGKFSLILLNPPIQLSYNKGRCCVLEVGGNG
ncbi:MAG: hypothetical protein PHC81_06040 [Clostridia bacterium]|nr:hypothetical protein [Clostridia bacterium]